MDADNAAQHEEYPPNSELGIKELTIDARIFQMQICHNYSKFIVDFMTIYAIIIL